MSQTVNVFSTVINGKLSSQARQVIINALAKLEGLEAHITISERKAKRSLSQNDLYWAVIVPTARMAYLDMGEALSVEQTHEALLLQFAPTAEVKLLDHGVKVTAKRSKHMTKEEMTTYIEAITAQLAVFGYSIERQQ
jgi:hypothetical protein